MEKSEVLKELIICILLLIISDIILFYLIAKYFGTGDDFRDGLIVLYGFGANGLFGIPTIINFVRLLA